MGDNLGPKGLSRVSRGFLTKVDDAENVADEADDANAVIDFAHAEALAVEHD